MLNTLLCNICRELDFRALVSGELLPEDITPATLENAIDFGPRSAVKDRSLLGCPFCNLCVDPPPKPGWDGWDEDAMRDSQTYLFPGNAHVRVHFKCPEGVNLFGISHVNVHLLDGYDSRFRTLFPRADIGLVKSWLSDCIMDHEICKKEVSATNYRPGGLFAGTRAIIRDRFGWKPKPPDLNEFFRLIDVRTREVVDIDGSFPISYAILSYVWGTAGLVKAPKFSETRDEKLGNRVPLPPELPATIAAALQLTSDLGIEFLWVDSLCINKADEVEKPIQLQNMAAIYTRAVVCIVAACGEHADAGFPGFDQQRTKFPQNPTKLEEDFVLGCDLMPAEEVMAGAKWSSRGWTYQESMLSRRCIIITESEVFYQCTQLAKRESWLNEPANARIYFPIVPSFPDMLKKCSKDFRGHLFTLYRSCVEEYTKRSLTYDSDCLNAFEGILIHLRQELGTDMVLGLPRKMLASTIVWDVRGGLRRRRVEKNIGNDDTFTSPLLPSWAWAAWEGQIHWGFNATMRIERPHHWVNPVWAHDFSDVRIPSELPAKGFEEVFAFDVVPGPSPKTQLSHILPIVAKVMIWPTPELWPESPVPGFDSLFWIHICDIWDKDRDTTAYCLMVQLLPYPYIGKNRRKLVELFGRQAADDFLRNPNDLDGVNERDTHDMPEQLSTLKRCPETPRETLQSAVFLAQRIYRASFDHDEERWKTAEFVPTLLLLG